MTETSQDIQTTHRLYNDNQAKWIQIHNCLAGEEAIKAAGETYLPYPVAVTDEDKTTDEYQAAYALYLEGGHFVEYTAEAVEDLVSSAFRRPLNIDPSIPEGLDYLDLGDLAKELTHTVGSYGRAFFFVDYPTIETSPTMADDGMNKAYVSIYEPLDVLNWVEERRSGKSTLVEVVLREIDELRSAEEGYSIFMYRKLKVVNGIYQIEIWRDEELVNTITPKATGKPFTEIPGMFLGTTSNTAKVDKSPVIGISNTNLKHYQTWAELAFVQTYAGHPQLTLTGLNPGFNKMMHEQNKDQDIKLKLDAANVLALEGEKADAKLLQLNTDSLVHFRTLEWLEKSMAEQGSNIKDIAKKAGVESAAALKIRTSSSMSKLSSIVANVGEGLTLMVKWVGQYMGVPADDIVIRVNTEFFTPEPDGDLLASLSEAEANSTAPRGTVVNYLKQIEIIDEKRDTEDYLAEMGMPCNTCNDTGVERDASGNVIGKKKSDKPSGDFKK